MASSPLLGKRGPSVLVTDSRERPPTAHTPSYSASAVRNRISGISVDRILQNASQVPSGQARTPPGRGPAPLSQRRPGTAPGSGPRVGQQNVPGRTTKVSEKLVLIPDTVNEKGDDEDAEEFDRDGDSPLTDVEVAALRTKGGVRGKSYAERLPKPQRTKEFSRATAYCTAQRYKIKDTATFVKETHGAKTKLYDRCLYAVYHLPLLPGPEGFRIRSSPPLKSPGGKAILDEEIDRNERRDYHEGYFEDTDTYGVRGAEESPHNETDEERTRREEIERRGREESHGLVQGRRADSPNRIAPDAKTFAELFIFSYGVVVFWNFTERQEKDILADMSFSEHETGLSLVSGPLNEDDFETEELHFEYNPLVERPRVLDDMITLRSGDHMIKLAMSHAFAQSTKLNFLEEKLSQTMMNAEDIPRDLAITGEIRRSRKEINMMMGRLYTNRIAVNLSKDILDVPEFFWESEPTLNPLYEAAREYLEINPRIKVLNERCQVFLDLTEILSDSISDAKMSFITWIIIILIVISILVTVSEVVLRFAILSSEKAKSPGMISMNRNYSAADFSTSQLEAICGMRPVGMPFADYRI